MNMTRPLRIEYPNATYHITARGNESIKIFRVENDYRKLLKQLRLAQQRYAILIHAYVLMGNHYHLLVETPKGNLSQAMHFINSSYTGYFNRRYHRVGHLFQGRYKSILVDKESYLLELSRYIHLNPVRAGIVKYSWEYPWSSCQTYLGKRNEKWVCQDWILRQFSASKEEARQAYNEFIEGALNEKVESPFKNIFAQVVLGSKDFIKKTQKQVEDQELDYDLPSLRRLKKRPSLSDILCLVAKYYGVEQKSIQVLRERGNLAKKVGIYLAHKYTGNTLKEIGQYFGGMKHTGASQVVSRLEKRRQYDVQLNQQLQDLKKKLQ